MQKQENFKKWFEKSKVRDEDQKPLVVFHGTSSIFPIEEFNHLSHFGSAKAAHQRFRDGGRDVIYPIVLNIKNPLLIGDLLLHKKNSYKKFFTKKGYGGFSDTSPLNLLSKEDIEYCFGRDTPVAKEESKTPFSIKNFFTKRSKNKIEEPKDIQKECDDESWRLRLIEVLERLGYDGFIYYNQIEDRHSVSYIPFRVEQIRSAIENKPNIKAYNYYLSHDKKKSLGRPTSHQRRLKSMP